MNDMRRRREADQPRDKAGTGPDGKVSAAYSATAEFVDKRTVAQFLGLSVRTVEKWTRERRIPCFRTGYRTVRYRLADIARAMRKNHFVEEIAG
jgi:excisionase family DNA binding protein